MTKKQILIILLIILSIAGIRWHSISKDLAAQNIKNQAKAQANQCAIDQAQLFFIRDREEALTIIRGCKVISGVPQEEVLEVER